MYNKRVKFVAVYGCHRTASFAASRRMGVRLPER